VINILYKARNGDDTEILTEPKKGCWVAITRPDDDHILSIAKSLDLDVDTLRDALDPYEAPRIAVDETDTYIFTRYCHPENKLSATEPLLILLTKNEIVTVSPYAVDFLKDLSSRLTTPTSERTKLMLSIFKELNQTYRAYLEEVTRMTLKIRTQITKTTFTNKEFLKMIDVEEDLNEMLTTLQSYSMTLEVLFLEKVFKLSPDEKELLEDIKLNASELIDLTRSRLRSVENLREVYNTVTSTALNATFKRLTSIAIFMSIPTIVGGLYGMNITLPLATGQYAFFGVLGLIAVLVSVTIYIFKRNKWL
jgi:magnesium transporter